MADTSRSSTTPLLIIAGPTASGKTACAVELCKLLNGLAPEIPCSGTTLEAALSQTMPHRQVLCGSLHLCGEALAIREKAEYRSSRY